jgi:ribosomal protein S18 acetylase RimI-like enzyme
MAMEIRDGTIDDIDGVASVWAAATAARDGHSRPAALEVARLPILAVTSRPDFVLVVAVAERIVAFALALSATTDRLRDADVRFVAVAPDHWGEGLGAQVLARLVERLTCLGHDSAQLLVYTDNIPAIRLYERLGWVAVDEPPSPHPGSGRLEGRYRLSLVPA